MSKKHDQIAKLREQFNKARRKGKWAEAQETLRQLGDLEPGEPRWPHQLGDILRRTGDTAGAVIAFEKATELYAEEGFVARAVAMAKTLLLLDPTRTDVLSRVNPAAAQAHHRKLRPQAMSAPTRQSIVHQAPKLEPAHDEADDEVRFFDVDDASVIELDISELELELDITELAPEREINRLALMPSFPLFSELPQDRLHVLAEGSDLVELPADVQVLEVGEPADALYCIVQGAVRVHVPQLDGGPFLGEGDVFGESCLLAAGVRQADVFVHEPLTALRISREVLDIVVEGMPALDDVLFELLARRVVGNFLGSSPLFTVFSPSDRRELAKRFEVRRAEVGVHLMVKGKRSDGLYALMQGHVTVDGADRGPGSILGVRSMLSHSPAEATVTTASECVLLRLPSAKLNMFIAMFPPALAHLSDLASREESLQGDALS